jgi:aspartyl-tRNA(Asn)/glutamyl-tRNA(Gln) amidotransferase subunit C
MKPKLIEDLEEILSMVHKMNKIDTDKIDPMSHPIDDAQNLREDISDKTIDRDAFQKYAPKTDNGFYLTPKVIEQND